MKIRIKKFLRSKIKKVLLGSCQRIFYGIMKDKVGANARTNEILLVSKNNN